MNPHYEYRSRQAQLFRRTSRPVGSVRALSLPDSLWMKILVGLAVALAVAALSASEAAALGVLIPKDKTLAPLAIKSHRVTVKISDQGAVTTVDQVFVNHTSRDLEATYLFPMPATAATTDFALWINGQRVKGEVLDAAQAKQIYRDIVARMKDPALLEYMGGNLFRASVYPVPRKGEQRIQISYAEVVPYDGGLCHYVYPLRTDEASARTIEDFTFSVVLRSSVPIKSVYSPTHQISVTREDDHRARAGFEENAALLDRDFSLFYTLSEQEVGVSMLTHRAKGEDGYFLLMIAPGTEQSDAQVLPKDVVFVIDTSGSMKGEKIKRAKEALSFCLSALRPQDRFGIVRFSDGIEPMAKMLLGANAANVEKGQAFVKQLRAVGGTNINEALLTSLQLERGDGRPGIIVFLTDGQPTVGVTDNPAIQKNIAQGNTDRWRLFSFGIGTSINTHLLDKLAEGNGGTSAYVRPDAQIEQAVSRFFNKVEKPVLADVSIDLGRAKIADMLPRKMPDLFAGTQLVLLGRYTDAAETAVVLEGFRRGGKVRLVQDVSLPKEESENGFIKQLWAQRKVGFLLGEIRLNGENRELVDEVTRLGREYGIVTPYTSYLVTEPKGDANGRASFSRRRGEDLATDSLQSAAPMAGGLRGEAQEKRKSAFRTLADRSVMDEEAGASAVTVSKHISGMKEAEQVKNLSGRTRNAGNKTFVWKQGSFVDTAHEPGNKTLEIRYGSDAYFALIDLVPEMKTYLALGRSLVVTVKPGYSIVIGDDGADSLSQAQLRAFLP